MTVYRAAGIEFYICESGVTPQRGQGLPLLVQGADVQPIVENCLGLQSKPLALEIETDQPSRLLQALVPFRVSRLGVVQVHVWATLFKDLATLKGALQRHFAKLLALHLEA